MRVRMGRVATLYFHSTPNTRRERENQKKPQRVPHLARDELIWRWAGIGSPSSSAASSGPTFFVDLGNISAAAGASKTKCKSLRRCIWPSMPSRHAQPCNTSDVVISTKVPPPPHPDMRVTAIPKRRALYGAQSQDCEGRRTYAYGTRLWQSTYHYHA
jgi:hypothetical protein